MRVFKSHGLGNDYLVLEDGPELTPEIAAWVCDRHMGAGGDGILEPRPTSDADYGVRIWNPDGSIAEKSGNGLRIFARWLVDFQGAPREFTVSPGFDVVRCRVGDESIAVEMGSLSFEPEKIPAVRRLVEAPLDVAGDELVVTAVSLANPHCLSYFETEDLDALPWRTWGPALENHAVFPRRINVQFARRVSAHEAEIRIWERGAGETLASGSSSCAVAAVGVATGRLAPGRITMRMPGGTLYVTVPEDPTTGSILLEGPVEPIYRLELDDRWLAARGLL